MVASLDKIIRRLTGDKVNGADLTVALVPGSGIVLKPLGSPVSEVASVSCLDLYTLLRQPKAEETQGKHIDDHAVVIRLCELAAVAVSQTELDEATQRERYLVTVRVQEICRRLREEIAEGLVP
jgi:hypothetical protein